MKMSTFIIYYFVSCSLIYKLSLLFVRGFYCTKSCNVKTGMFYLLLPSLMPFLCLSWLLLLILPILLCRSGGSEHLCSGPDLIGNTFSFSPFSILVMGLLCRKKKTLKKAHIKCCMNEYMNFTFNMKSFNLFSVSLQKVCYTNSIYYRLCFEREDKIELVSNCSLNMQRSFLIKKILLYFPFSLLWKLRVTDRQVREIFHLLVQSPDCHYSEVWQKPRYQKFHSGLHMVVPTTW